MARLTERTVQTAKAGRHGDGDGLYLVVSDTDRRKWILRYQIDGVRRDKGLALSILYPAWRKMAKFSVGAEGKVFGDGPRSIADKDHRRVAQLIPGLGKLLRMTVQELASEKRSERSTYMRR